MPNSSLQSIEKWLRRRNILLLLNNTYSWKFFPFRRLLSGSLTKHKNPQDSIAVLLHECGHVQQFLYEKKKFFSKKFPPIRKKFRPKDSFYVSVIQEELDAWEKAVELAKKLKIPRVKSSLNRMKNKLIMTYIKWAALRMDHSWMLAAVPKKQKKRIK